MMQVETIVVVEVVLAFEVMEYPFVQDLSMELEQVFSLELESLPEMESESLPELESESLPELEFESLPELESESLLDLVWLVFHRKSNSTLYPTSIHFLR